jgi:Pyridoxamine 5'-phosphate oxidase
VATHVVDGGDVIIRSQGRSPVISPVSAGEVVLAYEAGAVDPRTLRGWSVTVTGSAALVGDVEEMARYDRVLPRWPGSGGDGRAYSA